MNLKQYLLKASKLSPSWWRILILLALSVLVKSFVLVLWDSAAASLLIEKEQLFAMGADFIGSAVVLSLMGMMLWKLERRKGYGSVGATAICTLLCTLILLGIDRVKWTYLTHVIFIMKYVLWLALTTVYWSVAKKFMTNQFNSLRFLTLFCLELFGFLMAGGIIAASAMEPITALILAMVGLLIFLILIKTISEAAAIPRETFIQKTDGIQDVFEKPLVSGILCLSFLGTLARILTEALLYQKLSTTGIMPMMVFGLVWLLFGGLGLVIVMVLYHTRYIYTTLAGMFIYALSVIATGYVALGRHSGPLATGYLISLLGAHFYLNGYLQILPRILSSGFGVRLKKKVMTLITPLAFTLCGSLVLNLSFDKAGVILICVGCMLILTTLQTARYYAEVLFRMLEMRLWRQGPIMISFPRLVQYIKHLLKKENSQDVIYALRMLEIANHSFYEPALEESLKHKNTDVRCFALRKMRLLYDMSLKKDFFQKVMSSDKSPEVKNEALTNLIISDDKPQKYTHYLTDKNLSEGAISGFLSLGGDLALMAVKNLERLVSIKNTDSQLKALNIMDDYPSVAFVPETEKLIKSSSTEVAKKAIRVAGRLQDPQLLSFVFRALDDTELQESALSALRGYGASVFPAIEKIILRDKTTHLQRKLLVLFLSTSPINEAKQVLIRLLGVDNQKLRKNIIQSLFDSGVIWIHPGKEDFLQQSLIKDIDRISYLIHLKEQFSNAPSHESEEAFVFFLRAIQEDIVDTRQIILYQLLLLKNKDILTRAVRTLLSDSYDLYLPAMGVIQDLIPHPLYRRLKPVLMLPLAQRPKETLSGLSIHEAAKALSDVIMKSPYHLNHWIRATALYGLRRLGSERGIGAAEYALSDSHPVVFEAAIWTLVRLQDDKEALHRQLLTIPTSRLTQVALDELLES